MFFRIGGNTKQRLDKIAWKLNIPGEDVVKNALELYDVVVNRQIREKKSLAFISSSSLIRNKKEKEEVVVPGVRKYLRL